jgi:hypothetical protein
VPEQAAPGQAAPEQAAPEQPPVAQASLADSGWQTPDAYEEFARLASQHILASTAPQEAVEAPGSVVTRPEPLAPQLGPEHEHDHAPEQTGAEEPAWAFGERRSAARQARKPLPAALKEAVASGVGQDDLGESASQPGAPGQPPEPAGGRQGGVSTRDRGGSRARARTGTGTGTGTATGKKPGVIHRYASAIVIVVLFIAAAGAAAGIAAFRGPVTPPRTVALDQAAAGSVVLKAGDFPPAWLVSSVATSAKAANAAGATAASAYGAGSALVQPSVVSSWLTTHPSCSTDLDDLSEAMTPFPADATAVAFTRAAAPNASGGSWQIADAVAFPSSAAPESTAVVPMRSLVAQPHARACITQFWVTALQAGLPAGSLALVTLSQPAVPSLPRNPPVWAISMDDTTIIGQVSTAVHFEFVSFAVGHVLVSFAASSKVAPLPAALDARLLITLAKRAERHSS